MLFLKRNFYFNITVTSLLIFFSSFGKGYCENTKTIASDLSSKNNVKSISNVSPSNISNNSEKSSLENINNLQKKLLDAKQTLKNERPLFKKKMSRLKVKIKNERNEANRLKLQSEFYNLKTIDGNLSFVVSLLQKEISIQNDINKLKQEKSNLSTEVKPVIPTSAKTAQKMASDLSLLKNKEQLTNGKLESLQAELDVKKSKLAKYEASDLGESKETTDEKLRESNANILAYEIQATKLQIKKETLNLEIISSKRKLLNKVFDKIEPDLLVQSKEKLKQKERQSHRMRQKEEKRRDILSRERIKLQYRQKKLGDILAKQEKSLLRDNIDSEQKRKIKERIETLKIEQSLLKQKIKYINWKQKFSGTKIELEKKRVELEATKIIISKLSKDAKQRIKIENEIKQYLDELEKEKKFAISKYKVYQSEIAEAYILLDHYANSLQDIETALQNDNSVIQRFIKKEKLKQEELIQERIANIDQLKELMDQFRANYELQILRWDEVLNILKSTHHSFLSWKLLNSEITIMEGIQFFLGILLTLILAKLLQFFTRTKISKWIDNKNLVIIFEKPLRFLLLVVGIYLSTKFLSFTGELKVIVEKAFDTLIIVNISYMVLQVVDFLISLLIPIVEETETKLDDQLIPILRKTAKIFIIIISSVILIERLGYPVTSIIAGLGIGGLAFALAAKDTLANLFGSVVIFADRPFQIGDWVIIGGSEGVVEEVGVRSTKLRTFADTLITIPNNIVANTTIQNISAFRNRRVYIKIGITYGSGPDGASRAVAIIRKILDDNPMVQDGHYIFFDNFNESSLNLMVYYFVKSTVWREYLTVRGEVNLEIMREFAEAGIEFAFPTQTIEFAHGNNPDFHSQVK